MMKRRLIELVLVIQLPAKAFLDHIPAVARIGIGFEVSQPFVEDFAVPFRDRNAFGRGRDSVPERLQVIDLLVDLQIVEAGRWQRHKLGHEARPTGIAIQYNAGPRERAA
jgi:hypothetical protein